MMNCSCHFSLSLIPIIITLLAMLHALTPQGYPTRSNAFVGKGAEYLSGVRGSKRGDVRNYRIEMHP